MQLITLAILSIAVLASGSGLDQHVMGGAISAVEPSIAKVPLNIAPVALRSVDKSPWYFSGLPLFDDPCEGAVCSQSLLCAAPCRCSSQTVRISLRLLAF